MASLLLSTRIVLHAPMLKLGRYLQTERYEFVTITPCSHARVLARALPACTARDVLGWNRPFALNAIPPRLADLMEAADLLQVEGGLHRSRVRFSTLDGLLFAHSAYPTHDGDAVFFGPDTYRFAALLRRAAGEASRVVDIGCGSGAGGLVLAGRGRSVVLGDINPQALAFARLNAALANVDAEVVESDVLAGVRGDCDLVIANPPYLSDDAKRTYRDGQGAYGTALSVRIAREGIDRLRQGARGGRLILYSGAAVVDGEDQLLAGLRPLLTDPQIMLSQYEEIDPDVFGEELDGSAYQGVERIAAVSLVVDVSG